MTLITMSTTATRQTRRLTEKSSQVATTLRVTRGGKEITLRDLNESNDWRDLPGEVVIHGVRVMNRESKNGVVYHDKFIRRVAEIHQDHHAAWGHEDEHNFSRPPKTRFGMWRNGRVVEEGSQAVGADADLTIYEGDLVETNQLVTKAIRNPKALMFSIEVAEGAWDGYEDSEGITHATELKEMLDTAAVSFGGTTRSLSESQQSTTSKDDEIGGLTVAQENVSERLMEKAQLALKEECECHNKTKRSLEQVQADLAEAVKAKGDLEAELETLKGSVQESERRETVRGLAEKAGVKLQESEIRRYSKWTDDEVSEQLKKDAKLQESRGSGLHNPPTDSTDSSGKDTDIHSLPLL